MANAVISQHTRRTGTQHHMMLFLCVCVCVFVKTLHGSDRWSGIKLHWWTQTTIQLEVNPSNLTQSRSARDPDTRHRLIPAGRGTRFSWRTIGVWQNNT